MTKFPGGNTLKLISKNYKEIIIVGISTIALGFCFIFLTPGGPLNSDSLIYANYGLFSAKDPLILNRYFHIFLQKLFIKTAPDPLMGIQIYWAFLIASVCLFIYIFSRNLTEHSKFFHGILGVGLFLAFNEIGDSTGVTNVDISAMFMVMLVLLIYLFSLKHEHRLKVLLILFGSMLFFAFKTKETVLPVFILTLGFGFLNNKFNPKYFLSNLLYLAGGFLGGIVVFSIWSWIVLGDPFFGLMFSDISAYVQTYLKGGIGLVPGDNLDSWYNYAFSSALLIQILLYILSSVRIGPSMSLPKRLLLVLPPILLLFLAFTVNNVFGYTPRFFLPSLPLVCAIAPQFIVFNPEEQKAEKIKLAVIFLASLVLIAAMGGGYYWLVHYKWNLGSYIYVIFYPLVLTALFCTLFLRKTVTGRYSIVAIALVIALICPPLLRNIKVMAIEKINGVIMHSMLYPFSTFNSEIRMGPGTQIYITSDVWSAVGAPTMSRMLTEDQYVTSSLYNLYTNTHTQATHDNFVDSAKPSLTFQEFRNRDENYIILTRANWESFNSQEQTDIGGTYQPFYDDSAILVLLVKR